jgi:predicted transcriptional regulator with HTH domain
VIGEVAAKRGWSRSFLTRILYNKYTVATEIILKNYARSYSLSFLFSEGDPNMRQGIEGFGQFYHFETVLIFLGLIYAVWRAKNNPKEMKYYLMVFLWLLFAPIPSALTRDGGFHSSRLILMIPPLTMLSAMGFLSLVKNANQIKRKILFTLLVTFMLFDITRFFHRYFVIWPNESWRFWQAGFKQTLTFTKSQDTKYRKIFFNNTYEPMLPLLLFLYGYDMNLFQQQFINDVHTENVYPGFNGFNIGEKYYFGELIKPVERLASSSNLIVASGEKDITNPLIFENEDLNLLNVVYSPTEIPIFYIFSGK